MALACDAWTTPAANLAAIAAHIEAMRGIERWRVGSLDQAFSGYLQIGGPVLRTGWRQVLGLLAESNSLEEAEAAYRVRMRLAHPDAGGTVEEAARLNAAIEACRRELA